MLSKQSFFAQVNNSSPKRRNQAYSQIQRAAYYYGYPILLQRAINDFGAEEYKNDLILQKLIDYSYSISFNPRNVDPPKLLQISEYIKAQKLDLKDRNIESHLMFEKAYEKALKRFGKKSYLPTLILIKQVGVKQPESIQQITDILLKLEEKIKAHHLNNTLAQAQLYVNISGLYILIKEFEMSAQAIRKASRILKLLLPKPSVEHVFSFFVTAMSYLQQGMIDQAANSLGKVFDHMIQTEDRVDDFYLEVLKYRLPMIILALAQFKKLDKAGEFILKYEDLLKIQQVNCEDIRFYFNAALTEYKFQLGQVQEAKSLLKQTIAYGEKQKEVSSFMCDLYEQMYHILGQDQKADLIEMESYIKKAKEMSQLLDGEFCSGVFRAEINMFGLLLMTQQIQKAKNLGSRLLKNIEKYFPNDHQSKQDAQQQLNQYLSLISQQGGVQQ